VGEIYTRSKVDAAATEQHAAAIGCLVVGDAAVSHSQVEGLAKL
jgi:hypothetical protein